MKKMTILLVLITMTILISGCSNENELDKQSYTVGTWKTAQTIQPFFYDQFIEESSSLEVLPFTNPSDQKSALLAGDLDICGSTWVTAIIAASNGEPIKVISNLTEKCSALVVNNDSGIYSVADLKEKKIAYVPGTMHHILLLETLTRAGLNPEEDVDLVRIDFFDMGLALEKGDIDAFCSGEPYPSIAIKKGYGKILEYPYYEDSVGYINGVMIATEEKITNNPEKIMALVNAHVQSTKYLEKHPDICLSKASEFGTELEILEIASDNMALAWDLSPETLEQVKELAIQMKALGIIDEVPDIEALVDTSFLEKIKTSEIEN